MMTEKIAKNKGAIIYHRIDKVLVGKGYALDTMLKFIKENIRINLMVILFY